MPPALKTIGTNTIGINIADRNTEEEGKRDENENLPDL